MLDSLMHYLMIIMMALAAPALTPPDKGLDLKSNSPVTLPATKGHPTVVVFLSSKCPCSLSHEKHLGELKEKFADVQFIGIHSNSNESPEDSAKHFKESPITFPVLQDQKSKWANEWKALKTPHAFLFDESGKIVYKGGVSSSPVYEHATQFYLSDALTALKDHKPIPTAEGRTLGCFIER